MRVCFEKGEQRKFISSCLENKSLKEFLKFADLNISYSTFKGYYRETLKLPLEIFDKICLISGIKKDSLNFKLLPENWGAIKGGKKGIKSLIKKYPYKIREWRSNAWKKSLAKYIKTKEIKLPLLNEKLSELIGVYLGDGTLTKYFVRISGDKRYDLPYFNYLSALIENLLGIKPAIREKQFTNQLYLEIQSKLFCEHLNKKYALKFGSKIRNKTIIPEKIISDDKLFFACLRGLVDTDGSISKDNTSLSVRFSNNNPCLLNQIKKMNKKYNLFSFEDNFQLGIKSRKGVENYFKIVGSSNLRHIVRYGEFLKGNLIRKDKVLKYFPLYKAVRLPYYGLVV